MTDSEFRSITFKRDIDYVRIKQIPFSSCHKTFGDYEFDLILLIEFYNKGLPIPDWLTDRIKLTQSEL